MKIELSGLPKNLDKGKGWYKHPFESNYYFLVNELSELILMVNIDNGVVTRLNPIPVTDKYEKMPEGFTIKLENK